MALNTQNLRTPTTEEARKMGAMGGKASGKARAQKKNLAEVVKMINDLPVDSKTAEALKAMGVDVTEATNRTLFAYKVLQTAVGGKKNPDPRAMRLWAELSNEAKAEQTALENERLKLENEQLRKQLSGEIAQNYEDLTPLGKLLKRDENADSDD